MAQLEEPSTVPTRHMSKYVIVHTYSSDPSPWATGYVYALPYVYDTQSAAHRALSYWDDAQQEGRYDQADVFRIAKLTYPMLEEDSQNAGKVFVSGQPEQD